MFLLETAVTAAKAAKAAKVAKDPMVYTKILRGPKVATAVMVVMVEPAEQAVTPDRQMLLFLQELFKDQSLQKVERLALLVAETPEEKEVPAVNVEKISVLVGWIWAI